MEPITLKQPPDWQPYAKRPTWSFVTSAELAKVLGVHLQTINNWKIRGILPAPEFHPRLKGNKNYFRISAIRAWLKGKDEQSIHWEWLKNALPEHPFASLKQADNTLQVGYEVLGVEKPLLTLVSDTPRST